MDLTALRQYANSITYIINFLLIPTLIALALITFLWGVYRYFILGAENESEREKGKQFVLWGIIGFVVIVSVWGLVAVVGITLGLFPGTGAPPSPTI